MQLGNTSALILEGMRLAALRDFAIKNNVAIVTAQQPIKDVNIGVFFD